MTAYNHSSFFIDHERHKTKGEIRFVDTTLRDGQLSLWASNMTTGMMLPIVENIDRAGFEAFELLSSAFFKKAVRDLKEDLWERTRLVARRAKKTPLRAIRSRSMLAFQITPAAITELWLERLAANGITELRTSDPSNTSSYWTESVAGANRLGLKTILNIIYSLSPKHTDDYFMQRTREAAKLDVARICFKDPGGLLTPERTRALVPLILENADGNRSSFTPTAPPVWARYAAWRRSSSASIPSTQRFLPWRRLPLTRPYLMSR